MKKIIAIISIVISFLCGSAISYRINLNNFKATSMKLISANDLHSMRSLSNIATLLENNKKDDAKCAAIRDGFSLIESAKQCLDDNECMDVSAITIDTESFNSASNQLESLRENNMTCFSK